MKQEKCRHISLSLLVTLTCSSDSLATPFEFFLYQNHHEIFKKYPELMIRKDFAFIPPEPLQVMIVETAEDADKARKLMRQLNDSGFGNLYLMLKKVYWDKNNNRLIRILRFLLDVKNIAWAFELENASAVNKIAQASQDRKVKEFDPEVQFLLWLIDLEPIDASDEVVEGLWFVFQQPEDLRETLLILVRENIERFTALRRSRYLLEHLIALSSQKLPGINNLSDLLSLVGTNLEVYEDESLRAITLHLIGCLYRYKRFDHQVVQALPELHALLTDLLDSEKEVVVGIEQSSSDTAGGILSLIHTNPLGLLPLGSGDYLPLQVLPSGDFLNALCDATTDWSIEVTNLLSLWLSQPGLIAATINAWHAGASISTLLLEATDADEFRALLMQYESAQQIVSAGFQLQPLSETELAFQKWAQHHSGLLQNHPDRIKLLQQIYKSQALRQGLVSVGLNSSEMLEPLLGNPVVLSWLTWLMRGLSAIDAEPSRSVIVVENAHSLLTQCPSCSTNRRLFLLRLFHQLRRQRLGFHQQFYHCQSPLPLVIVEAVQSAAGGILHLPVEEVEGATISFITLFIQQPELLGHLMSGFIFKYKFNADEFNAGLEFVIAALAGRSEENLGVGQSMLRIPAIVAYMIGLVNSAQRAVRLVQFLGNLNWSSINDLSAFQFQSLIYSGSFYVVQEENVITDSNSQVLIPLLQEHLGQILSDNIIQLLAAELYTRFALEPRQYSIEELKRIISKK